MRYTRVIVTHYGGPDALRVVEEECPEPKSGEVCVLGPPSSSSISQSRQSPRPAAFTPFVKGGIHAPDFSFANSARRTKIDNHPTGGRYGLHPGA